LSPYRLSPFPSRPRPVILVVEDDPDQRRLYAELLGHEGIEVVEAADAESGVDMARQWMPNLVLMDVTLPGQSGWNAARVLKEDPDLHRIAIIAVTGLVGESDRDASYAAGCDEYLQKPVKPQILLDTVRAILRERGAIPE
jgi:two-component system cell cycle response regulator DivK